MGVKHKKTRKEKIIADYRHNFYTLEQKNISYPNSMNNSEIVKSELNSYSYVSRDVIKTGLLTFSIIAAQVILFFLLRNQIIMLPMLIY